MRVLVEALSEEGFAPIAEASIAAATGLVALTARKLRPERAALAAALFALNPVVVVHTVGGGHVDALIAAPLAGACALVATRPQRKSARAFAITVLITLACLIKTVMLPDFCCGWRGSFVPAASEPLPSTFS